MLTKSLSRPLLAVVFLAAVILAALFGGGLSFGPNPHAAPGVVAEKPEFIVTPQRRIHILMGDEKGGGHKFGVGNPGKTEFPKEWDDDKIIKTVESIANDKSLPMRPSGTYWLKMKEVEGLQIRVVLNRDRGEVVTSYPLNRAKNPPRKRRSAAPSESEGE